MGIVQKKTTPHIGRSSISKGKHKILEKSMSSQFFCFSVYSAVIDINEQLAFGKWAKLAVVVQSQAEIIIYIEDTLLVACGFHNVNDSAWRV